MRLRVLRDVRFRLRRRDEGVALVVVVGSMLVLAMFLMVGITYSMASTKFSRYDQDYAAALSAAQSGVEDFISRLNRDDNYGRTPDCANAAMRSPTTCGTAHGWAPVVPGETDPTAPHFHYRVDTSRAYTEGTIMVHSTGRSRDAYRTLEVAVGKGGSTDYVYYTDFESADPDNQVAYPGGTNRVQCGANGSSQALYHWQGRSGCQEIQFGTADVLDGRVFSNDTILSVGGRFLQGVESAFPDCRDVVPGNRSTWNRCLRAGSSFTATGANATFDMAPRHASILQLPDNSGEFATHPGCHYHGATRIRFNANGTMTVWSKDSNFSGALRSIAPPSGSAPSCGTNAQLASTSGATVNVPTGMVVYVRAAPLSSAPRRLLFATEIDGVLPHGTYSSAFVANPPTSGNPAPGTGTRYTADRSMTDPRKYRGEGNVYVEGVVKGRVTVAAAQSVVVTGDLVLADGPNGGDILGLVATNSVEVMHPRLHTYEWTNCTTVRASDFACTARGTWAWRDLRPTVGEYPSGTWPRRINDPATGARNPATGLQIAASIQTLQHSFTVQEYNRGRGRSSNGALYVRGSIAQRWRGAVGTAGSPGTGYDKDYRYDVRLRYTAPPYFPHWINAQWSARYTGEHRTPDELRS